MRFLMDCESDIFRDRGLQKMFSGGPERGRQSGCAAEAKGVRGELKRLESRKGGQRKRRVCMILYEGRVGLGWVGLS